jgi:adenine-specific DNA-methyltransferase
MTECPDLEQLYIESLDQRDELLNRIKASVPEAFSDGKLDAEALRDLLGDKEEDGPEQFTFTWAGERDALAMLLAPSSATLAPDDAAEGRGAAKHAAALWQYRRQVHYV